MKEQRGSSRSHSAISRLDDDADAGIAGAVGAVLETVAGALLGTADGAVARAGVAGGLGVGELFGCAEDMACSCTKVG